MITVLKGIERYLLAFRESTGPVEDQSISYISIFVTELEYDKKLSIPPDRT